MYLKTHRQMVYRCASTIMRATSSFFKFKNLVACIVNHVASLHEVKLKDVCYLQHGWSYTHSTFSMSSNLQCNITPRHFERKYANITWSLHNIYLFHTTQLSNISILHTALDKYEHTWLLWGLVILV